MTTIKFTDSDDEVVTMNTMILYFFLSLIYQGFSQKQQDSTSLLKNYLLYIVYHPQSIQIQDILRTATHLQQNIVYILQINNMLNVDLSSESPQTINQSPLLS